MTIRPRSAANDETTKSESFLAFYLEPFQRFLSSPDVTDLYINRVGEIWVESVGGCLARREMIELDEKLMWRLARQIASASHQGISRSEPLLAARLPDGARVQIVAPPATRDTMAIAVRRHIAHDLTLDDYHSLGAFDETSVGSAQDDAHHAMKAYYRDGDWPSFLRLAVSSRQTVLVSGGTSTGKTTFLNMLLKEVGDHERIILIEDTPELNLERSNAVGLVAVRGSTGEANVSVDDLLIASLRMRPDRIILGEIRGEEAYTFLRAINTGHPGSLSTIHANSGEQAAEHLALLVSQSGRLPRSEAIEYIMSLVDVFVHLENDSGRRKVKSVSWNRCEMGNDLPPS